MKIFLWWIFRVEILEKKRVKWDLLKRAISKKSENCNRCTLNTTVDKNFVAMLSYRKHRQKSQ